MGLVMEQLTVAPVTGALGAVLLCKSRRMIRPTAPEGGRSG